VYLPPSWLIDGFLKRDQAAGLSIINQMVTRADDSEKYFEHANEINAEIEALPKYYLMSTILVHSFKGAFVFDLRTTAVIRSARLALAAERYRLDNGRFPENLEQLTGRYIEQVPIDPFDGQPLRYLMDKEQVTIYSVYENMQDDGGNVLWERCDVDGRDRRDQGFVLLAPAQRGQPAQELALTTASAPTD